MTLVYLAGKEWRTRALLRAQLIEEGVDVEAHESLAAGVASLEAGELLPGLLVADLTESDDADIGRLARWAKEIPIWVIAGRSVITEKSLKGRGFEMIFFRPVDVGELVDQIKRRVEET